jgi:hypothetical protein
MYGLRFQSISTLSLKMCISDRLPLSFTNIVFYTQFHSAIVTVAIVTDIKYYDCYPSVKVVGYLYIDASRYRLISSIVNLAKFDLFSINDVTNGEVNSLVNRFFTGRENKNAGIVCIYTGSHSPINAA